MDYFRTAEISTAGMAAQMARIEATTLNIANIHTSAAPGQPGYQPLRAVIHATPAVPFSDALAGNGRALSVPRAQLAPQQGVAPRSVYEPGHPHANSAGMVSYPAVDQTQEMMTAVAALRAYEANLAVLQTTRTFANRALEIGGQ